MQRAVFIVFWIISYQALAQTGLGFRFASNFNHFYQAEKYPLVDNRFSNICVGPYFQWYNRFGGLQLGLNWCYKGLRGQANLPLVAQDFSKYQNTALTSLEIDFKFGPRLWRMFYPRTGYTAGWRLKQDGFWDDDHKGLKLATFYANLPLGFSIDLPTGFGTTGFGVFYNFGLTNVIKNPNPQNNQTYDGSKLRNITFEITVLFGIGEQE